MRTVSRFLAVVAMLGALVAIWTGCAVGPSGGASEASAPASEVQQALTGCELDCPDGSVLTCGLPCSVPDANTLICNGVTSHCTCTPHSCNGCGLQDDGCGHQIDCGPCDTGCPTGKVDCCGDGTCVTPAICRKLVLQGTC